MHRSPQDWADTLRIVARSGLETKPPTPRDDEPARRAFVDGFHDELGHRRPMDEVFLSAHLGLACAAPADPTPETRVWFAALDSAVDVPIAPGDGPLLPDARGISIEAWTETELCALHALWRCARIRGDDSLRDRAFRAVEWHIEFLDPENATHTPWAIHVFLARWFMHDDADARVHAEAMLHGSQIQSGKPDRRSCMVLLDAAEELGLLDA